MKILHSNKFGATNVAELDHLESRHDIRLPADYRSFLLDHNGGDPRPSNHFDVVGNDEMTAVTVHYFHGIFQEPLWASLDWLKEIYKDRIIPEGLPIACDGVGNQIVLIARGEKSGELFFWDHELETDPPGFDNMTFLAASFGNFITKLYEYVDPAESNLDRLVRENDVAGVIQLLDQGFDIETTDEYGRTLIENAAIQNRPHLIALLAKRGASLTSALTIAEENLELFPDDLESVELLRRLASKTKT
jgi:SMI1 / KNR4 family (SUKH-1)